MVRAHIALQELCGLAYFNAEVILLRGQIDVDRALLTDSNPLRPDGGTSESSP